MIPNGVQVFVALEPVDMRWSFDRLASTTLMRSAGRAMLLHERVPSPQPDRLLLDASTNTGEHAAIEAEASLRTREQNGLERLMNEGLDSRRTEGRRLGGGLS